MALLRHLCPIAFLLPGAVLAQAPAPAEADRGAVGLQVLAQEAARLIRESIRSSLIPTVDSAKTVGLVSLPGMMSGLIFAGIDPVKAIKYQIMVTFMLLSTASLSTIIACYLTYRKFYNTRHQLVVTQLKKTG